VPDYYDVVKKPIDLATMEGRCISDLYTTPQKFVDDFALMMNNAVLYNTVRTSPRLFLSDFQQIFCILLYYIYIHFIDGDCDQFLFEKSSHLLIIFWYKPVFMRVGHLFCKCQWHLCSVVVLLCECGF